MPPKRKIINVEEPTNPKTPKLGVIDDEAVPLLAGKIISPDIYRGNGDLYDVKLVQLDIATETDKYFILQLITDSATAVNQYYVFTRFGETGLKGESKLDGPFNFEDAMTDFETRFFENTGNKWTNRSNFKLKAKKYRMININHDQKLIDANCSTQPDWEYYVDDFVDGKATGWYNFTKEGAAYVEELWVTYQNNKTMIERVVQSGQYRYHIDLAKMTQRNMSLSTGKVRLIRRSFNGVIHCSADADAMMTPNKQTKVQVQRNAVPQVVPPTRPIKLQSSVAQTSITSGPVKSGSRPVDSNCPLVSSGGVVIVIEDFDCTLNQVDLGRNANKFYRIQLLQKNGAYHLWTRWGRVGEVGQSDLKQFSGKEEAAKAFEAKFRDKTGNAWSNRNNFESKAKKYDLLIMKDEVAPQSVAPVATSKSTKGAKESKQSCSQLAEETQNLLNLILDQEMFKSTMQSMNLDLKRMPLGALSAAQVQKGYTILEEMKTILTAPVWKGKGKGKGKATTSSSSDSRQELITLSGSFYQTIPHSFPRNQRPTPIDTIEELDKKFELLSTLEDIAVAQGMITAAATEESGEHPLDSKYKELNADLDLVTQGQELDAIMKYIASTKGYHNIDVDNVWAVRRAPEDPSFAKFQSMDNHRLLWHGTNVAVVAAILKTGLRIMPSVNGGRVGRGIYMANELSKSASYVRTTRDLNGNKIGILFLVEAALGKMKEIHHDDPSLTQAPPGFDSVLAKGTQHPDPTNDIKIKIDGIDVLVPQAIPLKNDLNSSFSQDEYLIYKEPQQRLRFVLTFKYH